MIRKKGKLPGSVVSYEYELEYGSDSIEIQSDAVNPNDRVVILDDLLATGGTMAAALKLLENEGATVPGAACIVELSFLRGRSCISCPVETLVTYDE